MSKDSKTPDLQALARHFADKKIDWVAEKSMFRDMRYIAAIGHQFDKAGSTLDGLVRIVATHIMEPKTGELAAALSQSAPELAPALKNINVYAYAGDPAAIDSALSGFIAEKPWHPEIEKARMLHAGLQRFRDEFVKPMDRAQAMMARISHLSALSPGISLMSKSLDSTIAKGIEGLETLGGGFLEFKNSVQALFKEGPERTLVERAFSDADDTLKIIADDARKVQAAILQAKAISAGGSPPPPPM